MPALNLAAHFFCPVPVGTGIPIRSGKTLPSRFALAFVPVLALTHIESKSMSTSKSVRDLDLRLFF